MQKGKAIIFSAPSGAGKTTIVKHLLSSFAELAFSGFCHYSAQTGGCRDRWQGLLLPHARALQG